MGTLPLVLIAAHLGLTLTPGYQTPLSKHITLTIPAEPIPKLIADLSKASGVPMEATMTLRYDVAILDVRDLPLSEIQDKLAATLDGTWRLEKGVYRFTRTDKQATDQEKRERQHRISQMESEFAKSKGIRDTPLTAESARKLANQYQQMREKNPRYAFAPYMSLDSPLAMAPAQKMLLRLATRLDPSDFAMLQPGDRLVFSDKPTRVQRKLPFDTSDLLAQFGSEIAIWNDAVAGIPPAQDKSSYASDPLLSVTRTAGNPDRVILMANRSNSMSSVQFRMFIKSGDNVMATADLWLANDFIRDMSMNMLNEPNAAGQKITLSPKTQTMLDLTKGFQRMAAAPGPDPTPSQVALLTHPEDTDPLGMATTDGFESIAAVKHLNLIASVPDDLIFFNFLPTTRTQTLDGFLKQAQGIGDLDVSEKDGWLTVKPNRPFSARFDRIDRGVLGKYLRSIVTNGRATLDAQGEFAFNSPATDYDQIGMPMGMLIDLNSTQNVDKDWDSLKLWGSLSREQKQALIAGAPIQFKDLTPVQIALVQREAYNHSTISRASRINWTPGGSMLSLEPTECLPDGIPPEGQLTINATQSPALLASSTTKNVRISYARLYSPTQLGNSLAMQDDPNSDWKPMFDRFTIVDRVEYKISYQFTPDLADAATLHDVVLPKGSQPVGMSNLPSDMQKEIADARANTHQNSPIGGVRRTPPPQ